MNNLVGKHYVLNEQYSEAFSYPALPLTSRPGLNWVAKESHGI
jgi:hypothetical protein